MIHFFPKEIQHKMEELGIESSDCSISGNSVDVVVDSFDDGYSLRETVMDCFNCQLAKEQDKIILRIFEFL